MKKLREVTELIEPIYVMEGAGVLLRRSIAGPRLDYLDPFLLFDHFGSSNPNVDPQYFYVEGPSMT